jgi:hypothetical protein
VPRYTEKQAKSTAAPRANVSTGEARAATNARLRYEKATPERFESPEIPKSAVDSANAVSQKFEHFLAGTDERNRIASTDYSGMVGGEEFWKPQDVSHLENEVLPTRYAETRGAAVEMGSPGAKWEQFSPQRKADVLRKLQGYGVTADSAYRSFSAQVAQGIAKGQHLSMPPYASGFYFDRGYHPDETAKPREQVARTAQDLGVGYHVAATAHAMLSPQLPFEEYGAHGAKNEYNDDAARHAIMLAKSNVKESDITTEDLKHLHPNARNAATMRNTVHVVRQLISGKSLGEVSGINGQDPFGPKTGPYLHAWLDPNSPDAHLVADTHTARGFAPHLTTDQKDEMLGINGVHAFFDHIGRKVMQDTGLHNIHWTQATQWGAQRLFKSNSMRKPQVSEESAYQRPNYSPEQVEQLHAAKVTKGQQVIPEINWKSTLATGEDSAARNARIRQLALDGQAAIQAAKVTKGQQVFPGID